MAGKRNPALGSHLLLRHKVHRQHYQLDYSLASYTSHHVMFVAAVIAPGPTEMVIERLGGTIMPPVNPKLNMPAAIGSDMNCVGVPLTVPADVLAVAMLVVVLPN